MRKSPLSTKRNGESEEVTFVHLHLAESGKNRVSDEWRCRKRIVEILHFQAENGENLYFQAKNRGSEKVININLSMSKNRFTLKSGENEKLTFVRLHLAESAKIEF